MKQTEKKLIRLTAELKEQIDTAAAKEGISSNDYIRLAIEERLGKVYTQPEPKAQKVYTQTTSKPDKVYTQPEKKESNSAFERFRRFRPTAGDKPSTQQMHKEALFGK